jgi:hypothetical protein
MVKISPPFRYWKAIRPFAPGNDAPALVAAASAQADVSESTSANEPIRLTASPSFFVDFDA